MTTRRTSTPSAASQAPSFQVGKRLGALRAERGLSQGTVSRLAGVAPSYLSRIENGRIQPTFPTLWRIVRALHASFDEVLAPDAVMARRRAACPISATGECLTQLIRSEAEVVRDRRLAFVSPRQMRLLHDLAGWMRTAGDERVRALEILLQGLTAERPPAP